MRDVSVDPTAPTPTSSPRRRIGSSGAGLAAQPLTDKVSAPPPRQRAMGSHPRHTNVHIYLSGKGPNSVGDLNYFKCPG